MAATLTLPFDQARTLEQPLKAELEIVLRDMLVTGDLKKLAKKWEPARKLDAEMLSDVRSDLIDLLQGRRPLYEGLKGLDLASARANPERTRALVERSMPTADATKLLKNWKVKPVPDDRDDIIALLIEKISDQPVSRVA